MSTVLVVGARCLSGSCGLVSEPTCKLLCLPVERKVGSIYIGPGWMDLEVNER